MHHIVLALPPGEVDPRDAASLGEGPQPRREVPAHRGDHRGRGDRLTQVAVNEAHHALRPLQLGHIQVAVQTVARFELEAHVIRQHIGHGAR